MITYAVLLGVAVLAYLVGEWTNPRTLGPVDTPGKLVIGLFHGVQPRTTGFNSIDMGEARPATLLIADVLMFIGGGSGSTAGGIKVTTFAVLASWWFRGYRATNMRLFTYPRPTVAAVNGHAFAGGLITAAVCDYRVAVDDGARFGLNATSPSGRSPRCRAAHLVHQRPRPTPAPALLATAQRLLGAVVRRSPRSAAGAPATTTLEAGA